MIVMNIHNKEVKRLMKFEKFNQGMKWY